MCPVRFDADGDELTRTTDLPAINPLTFCCWYKPSVDINTWSHTIGALWSDTNNYLYIQTDSDGTTFKVWTAKGGTFKEGTLVNATIGTWYFFAYVVSGTQAVTGYYADASASGLSSQNVNAIPSGAWFTPTTMKFGDSVFTGEYANGVLANPMFFSAALTQAQLENLRWQYLPQFTSNLHA